MTAVARARTLPMWRAFDVPDFRLLWASEAVSLIGDQFHLIAMAWLVISLTGSGLALGTVLIAVGVPRAIMLLPFGVLADRRSPRNMMLAAHVGRGLVVAIIAILAATGAASIPALVGLGVLFGIADAIYMPAQQAFVPRVVSPDRLPSANSLLQGTMQLASIAGPPLAGLAIALVGTGVAFSIDAVSFVIAAGLITMLSSGVVATVRAAGSPVQAAAPGALETSAATIETPESFGHALRAGLSYVARDPAIRTLMLLSLLLNLALGGPGAVGMAWLAQNRFDAGPIGLGLMEAGFAAGALLGTMLAGNASLDRQGRIVVTAVMAAGLATVVIGVLGWLPGTVIALFVLGLSIGYTNIVAISWLQARVEPALIGRVMSLVMLMGFGIMPLSLGLAGALIDANAVALFVAAGLLVIGAGVLGVLVGFPAMLDGSPDRTGSEPLIATDAASTRDPGDQAGDPGTQYASERTASTGRP
jgi:MFS family permease